MRKYILLAITALMLCGCGAYSIPSRLDRFVTKTERRADRYRPRDWQVSIQKYENLVKEYTRNYRNYTTSEKKQAMNAIGRYHALLVDHGLKESLGIVYDLKSIVPAYLEGILDIFKADKDAARDFLDSVLGLGRDEIGSIMDRLDKSLAE